MTRALSPVLRSFLFLQTACISILIVTGFLLSIRWPSVELPKTKQSTIQTKVTAKSFWENGKSVRPGHELQPDGSPRIDLGRKGYVLYGVEEESDATNSQIAVNADDKEGTPNSDDPNRPPQEIAMLKDDLSEIELLIRKGTPVTIILNRE